MPSIRSNLFLACAAVVSVAGLPQVVSAAEQSSTKTAMQLDKNSFIAGAASGGMFEVQSSQLALQKATSDEIKKFARQMIKDHNKANKQLAGIAKKEGMNVPDTLSPKDATALSKLNSVGASDFDKTYISLQEQAHTDAVALFQTYSASPDDKKLGRFAKKTLPTIQMHLEHVKTLSTM